MFVLCADVSVSGPRRGGVRVLWPGRHPGVDGKGAIRNYPGALCPHAIGSEAPGIQIGLG